MPRARIRSTTASRMLDGAGDNEVGAKKLANALRTAAGRAG